MAISAQVAGLIKKRRQETDDNNEALQKIIDERTRIGFNSNIDLAALQLDEQEKERAKVAGSAATDAGQGASTPDLSKVDVGAVAGELDKLFKSVQKDGGNGGQVLSEQTNITQNPSNPRRETRTTETTRAPTKGGGPLGDLVRLFSPEFGVRDRSTTSTTTGDSAKFETGLQQVGVSLGSLSHNIGAGRADPGQLATFGKEQLEQYNPQELTRIRDIAKRTKQEMDQNLVAIDLKNGTQIGLRMAENGVADGQLGWRIATADNGGQLSAALTDYQQALHDLPEAQQHRATQRMLNEKARLTLDKARIDLDTSEITRAVTIRDIEKNGIFANAGATTGLTDNQLADQKRKAFENKSGNLEYDEGKLPQYLGLASADLANWKPVDMLMPGTGFFSGADRFFGATKTAGRLEQFDPQEAYTHFQALGDQGYDSRGNPTGDTSLIDPTVTKRKKEFAVKWFNGRAGRNQDQGPKDMFLATLPGEGETESSLTPREDHAYITMIAQWYRISLNAVAAGRNRDDTVLNPGTFQAEQGVALQEVEGRAPPPRPVSAPFRERFKEAVSTGQRRQLIRRLEEAQGSKEREREEALGGLNFPPTTLGR